MKAKLLKNFVKITGVAALSYGTYLYACGGGDDFWEAYNSLFAPEIAVPKKEYKPLFLDSSRPFYNADVDQTKTVFLQINNQDWSKYLGKSLSAEAIDYYLYSDEAMENINKYKSAVKNKKSVSLPHSPSLQDKKVQNFFTFLEIARGNEQITNAKYDPWNYDERNQLKANAQIVKKVEDFYQKMDKSDSFFANRIWFQVLRLKFYSDNRSATIAFFDQTKKEQPKDNSLYFRALNYVSGAYKAQKNYAKSNIILAEIFDSYPSLITSATFEYRPMSNAEINQILPSLTPSQQCALWAMQGFYGGGDEEAQKIIAINPKSPHVDFLLSRIVNKIENQANNFGYYSENKITSVKEYQKHTQRVVTEENNVEWILKTAESGNVHNPYLWNLAAGYMSTFKNDFKTANKFLQKANGFAKNEKEKKQVRLLHLMNELTQTERIDSAAENRLLADLQDLWYKYDDTQSDQDLTFRNAYLNDFARGYLSALYKQQNNPLMAELTLPTKGFYKDKNQSVAMENFLLSNQKTKWEQFWADKYAYSLADIYQSRGIYFFYQNKIDEAIAEFQKITSNLKNFQLPANPFNGRIRDCNDCDHAAQQRTKYSFLSFLLKIKEMQQKIANNDDVYNNALLVGNAFYNASYFGNARAFYYNPIIGEYGNHISDEHQTMLLGMQNVKKYYELAQKHATTDEQKAKMAYMLAKVERNEFYNQIYFMKPDGYYGYGEVMFKDWKGFKELRSQYAHTKYYKEVINECGYFGKTVKR